MAGCSMPGALAVMEASTSYRPPAEVLGSCTAACCGAELAGKSMSSGAFVGSGRAMEMTGALCCACCCCGSCCSAAGPATGAVLLCSMVLPGSMLPPCTVAAIPHWCTGRGLILSLHRWWRPGTALLKLQGRQAWAGCPTRPCRAQA